MFVSKGFSDAEDLGDTVINRVMKKLPEIRDTYVGEQVRYFHGVARNIMRETIRRKEVASDVTPVFLNEFRRQSDEYDCLIKCLRFLPSDKCELILDYYIYDGRDKIVHHRQMATELGISEGALRGRAHHLRANLEKCIRDCLDHLSRTKPGAVAAGSHPTEVQ
jgi:DNA-directed RNA polymerase specialized sigma24 family protein